jgi:hypothetical protein
VDTSKLLQRLRDYLGRQGTADDSLPEAPTLDELAEVRLCDPASSVTKQVVLMFRRKEIDGQLLLDLIAPANPPHVRAAAHKLLRERDPWPRLLVNLRIISDPDEPMRKRAQDDLRAWLQYEAATTYSMPSKERADQLAASLTELEPMLGQHTTHLLRFHCGLTRSVR